MAPPSILNAWKSLSRFPPFMRTLAFRYMVSSIAPYSGTIFPNVQHLDTHKCLVSIKERRILKNPFNSIHAVALTNLGELASGVMVMSALQENGLRGIVTKLDTEYHKKAKGVVTAEALSPPYDISGNPITPKALAAGAPPAGTDAGSTEAAPQASGPSSASSETPFPVKELLLPGESEKQVQFKTTIRDEAGDVVAITTARWIVRALPQGQSKN
ncbi:hypothetical protein H696_02298 [Fonticula alba]|uniref:DUF4442 domain-containing protein n=1 Tax=Fonticula alba TaxID=691883 RepID=A0A058ZAH4_FONAL|nr:hypothetical protein H696_02298 [Fonticula alba]KCV71350.1 hypothetical protein H696_02298 [Fonticula alba]|eukprot:XP_009494473.1 hypothetical protein H696_02298 [Fonticula alba]